MDKIKKFQEALQNSQRIVFFSGAGMSTESGISDFRSADGLYMAKTHQDYSPEEVVSHRFLETHPQEFFDYYFEHLVSPEARPNAGHHFIAQLEEIGKDVTVVTQNIDGLHQVSGSSKVYELHGSVHRNYCVAQGHFYTYEELILDDQGIPCCPEDGSLVRPEVVLYGEVLDPQVVEGAIEAIRQADLLVILGTSLVVYPAAGLIDYYQGKDYVVINKTPIQTYRPGGIVFESTISEVFEDVRASLDL